MEVKNLMAKVKNKTKTLGNIVKRQKTAVQKTLLYLIYILFRTVNYVHVSH